MRTPTCQAEVRETVTGTGSATETSHEDTSSVAAYRRERSRIAFDIHDGPAQSIALALQQTRGCMDADPNARERLRDVERQLLVALDELYGLMEQLRGDELERSSVAGRIESLARDFSSESGIPVDVRVARAEALLSDPVRLALFQIVREALRNVGRHAEASGVSVVLRVADDVVECVVEDDGKGFEPKPALSATRRTGYGLIGMREHARLLGGECSIESRRGVGCRVLVSLPVGQG